MSARAGSEVTLAAAALYARVLGETFRCSNPGDVIAGHLRPGLSCEAVYAALADLRELGYIEAADGASGWCRITPEGVRAYEQCTGGELPSAKQRAPAQPSRKAGECARARQLGRERTPAAEIRPDAERREQRSDERRH